MQNIFFKKDSNFINATLLLTTANIFSAVINYILQILYSRNFSVENFGIYNATNGLTFYYSFFLFPLANKIITDISQFSGDNEKLLTFLNFSSKRLFMCVTLISTPAILLMFGMGLYTKLPVLFIFSMILVCVISNLYIIFQGFLQGMHLFYRLAFITFLLPIVRFFGTYIIFYNGLSINAIFIFAVIFQVITCIFYYIALPTSIKAHKIHDTNLIQQFSTKIFYRNFIIYILQTGIIYLLFSFMMQSDTLLIKIFFSEYDTGLYSSASLFGKAIVFLSTAVTLVLFPYVTKNTADDKSSLAILLKGIIVNLFIAGSGVVILFCFPQLIVMFFGEKYHQAIPIMKYIGIAFLPLSILNILFTFYLAKQRFDCFIPLFIAFITEIVYIVFFHTVLMHIILSFFISGIIGCIGFFLLEVIYSLKRKSI